MQALHHEDDCIRRPLDVINVNVTAITLVYQSYQSYLDHHDVHLDCSNSFLVIRRIEPNPVNFNNPVTCA